MRKLKINRMILMILIIAAIIIFTKSSTANAGDFTANIGNGSVYLKELSTGEKLFGADNLQGVAKNSTIHSSSNDMFYCVSRDKGMGENSSKFIAGWFIEINSNGFGIGNSRKQESSRLYRVE